MDVELICSSPDNYDSICQYIAELKASENEESFHPLVSGLVSIFGNLAKQGVFSARSDSKQQITSEWLTTQLNDLWTCVLDRVGSKSEQLAIMAFTAAMKIILINGKYRKKSIRDDIASLLEASLDSPAVYEWSKYVVKYDDVRMWFYHAIADIDEENEARSRSLRALIPTMCEIDKKVEDDDDLHTFYAKPFTKASKYRSAFQKAWLKVLQEQTHITQSDVKTILTVLHARIIPNFVKPQLLMDFLVDAYDFGGAISLLALDGLFALIQYHGLDYPHFYTKLYHLLEDGSILFSSHRARFLRLLDLFLSSSHLPATIPASMIKRLARLCLFAPPGAIVAIIPLVYNQLKRHQTCMVMIHRSASQSKADMFIETETDPLLTHALESSLWELHALTTHYQPNVAALAKIFEQPFRKPSYQLEHFLAHSYETMYSTERNRKREGVAPALEYEECDVFNEIPWTM